jgi:hypothetical protein
VLRTRPPLDAPPKRHTPFDLHVLRTPPAFVLSQDQTRHSVYVFDRELAPPNLKLYPSLRLNCLPRVKTHRTRETPKRLLEQSPLQCVTALFPLLTLLLLLTLQLSMCFHSASALTSEPRFASPPFSEALDKINTSQWPCQGSLSNFLKLRRITFAILEEEEPHFWRHHSRRTGITPETWNSTSRLER